VGGNGGARPLQPSAVRQQCSPLQPVLWGGSSARPAAGAVGGRCSPCSRCCGEQQCSPLRPVLACGQCCGEATVLAPAVSAVGGNGARLQSVLWGGNGARPCSQCCGEAAVLAPAVVLWEQRCSPPDPASAVRTTAVLATAVSAVGGSGAFILPDQCGRQRCSPCGRCCEGATVARPCSRCAPAVGAVGGSSARPCSRCSPCSQC
jgi:hypothetical protein